MKRPVAALLLSLLFISVIVAQNKESDREKEGLNGPVKSVRVEIVNLDDSGKPDKNRRWLSRVTSYDPQGNKTEDETFYAFGKISYGRHVYTFDSNGNKVGEERHINGSVYKQAHIHNDLPALIPDDVYQVNRYKYDERGRLTAIIRTDKSGSEINRQVFNYDDEGRVVEWAVQKPDNSVTSQEFMTYDEQGRMTSESNGKDPKEKFYRKVAYAYDENGIKIKEEDYDNEGLWVQTTYTYDEFDKVGNWTKRTETRWHRRDGIRTSETYRTITYYEGISSTPAVDDTEKRDVKRPRLLNRPRANYTKLAAANKVEGVVRVRVLIGEDGLVKRAFVVEGLPDGLNEEAIRAAFLMKFEPARIDGRPIKYWQLVDVEFKR